MRGVLYAAACTVFVTLTVSPAAAQDASTTVDEEAAVRSVVDRLFDGMRTRDTTMMRSVFADEAQFYVLNQEGLVQVVQPGNFIRSISQAPAGLVLDEVLHDVEIRVDGPLAIVWTYYDFFAGDEFRHCGYDAIQMLKVRDEWKIVALSDTRRTEGCRRQRS